MTKIPGTPPPATLHLVRGEDAGVDALGPDAVPGPMCRIKVRDGVRVVAFTGTQLGHITSERQGSLRWTELSIYRTQSNLFVAHRVGVSCVAHRVDCAVVKDKILPSIVDMRSDEFAVEDRQPCQVCRPDIAAELDEDPDSIRGETDRHWAGICNDGVSLINALHTMRHGVRSLSGLASAVLSQASEHDAQLSDALNTELEV
ncbi:hypothetical protein [Rhodococcus marinonascens]|uniref:hypothetical protein n=1 Tax=Rhodococcus marinonascens TaxID=38311 RepID=UPI0009349D68|nr:hypothetical protein [Rhodococcus marinonascens]